MNLNQFLAALKRGGTTSEGDVFSVRNGILHILSPRNRNQNYNILPAKVNEYFTTDIPKFGVRFGSKRSAYFLNVYRHIVGDLEYDRVMAAAQERNRR